MVITMTKIDPTTLVASPVPAVFASVLIGAFALISAVSVAFVLLPPTGWSIEGDAPIVVSLPVLRMTLSTAIAMTHETNVVSRIVDVWLLFAGAVSRADAWLGLLTRALGCFLVTRAVTRAVYLRVLKATPKLMLATHARGPQPLEGGAGTAYLAETWRARNNGAGIALLPGLTMPLNVESEGIAAIGRPGSGKSVIVEGLAAQALARGDRAFFLDVKGNLARRLRQYRPLVLALRGRNIAVWAVGADVSSELDALEFAAVLIPESREPVWAAGSRLILAAIVRHCQARYGQTWGWTQLHAALSLPIPRLEHIVHQRMPEVAKLLQSNGEDPSNTVLSLILNLVAHVGGIVQALAQAERRTDQRVSLTAWSNGRGSLRPIILPLDIRYRDQTAALGQFVMQLLRANLLAPEMPTNIDHRIWLFLDELPRIGKGAIGPVQDLAALGRDRGIRTVMTCQSPQQLVDLLGEAGAVALRENFGLQIICRAAAGENAHAIAEKWVGKRTVRWIDHADGKTGKRQSEEIYALPAETIVGDLGLRFDLWGRSIIRAAILGYGNVPIVDWKLRNWPSLR